MPRVAPFVGLLYERSKVGSIDRVSAPPYDVISEEDRRRYLRASPYNIARILLGEAAPDADLDRKYRSAASEFRRWREEGILRPTAASLFPYEMAFTLDGVPRRVRGVICAVSLADGGILPHEDTMPGPVEDRLALTRAVGANLCPILATVRGPVPALSSYLMVSCEGEPAAQATDREGVTHRLWVGAEGPAVIGSLAREDLMIADGHHRFRTSLRYRDEMRVAHGPGPWDEVMMLVLDEATEAPPVLPYHRILRRGPAPVEGARVPDLPTLLSALDDEALRYGTVSLEAAELVHRVAELPGDPPTVLTLHRERLAGLEDDLTYTPDAALAQEAVARGQATAAYLLPPTRASRIRAVVDRGERLPRKSTFFWPKPRTGLVLRPLDPSR